MPAFEIKTHSTFENVYWVEASDLETAIKKVQNNYDPPDFMQKHLWEDVSSTCISPDTKWSEWYQKQKSIGYD